MTTPDLHPGSTCERQLDPRMTFMCWHFLARNHTVHMCVSTILQYLFGGMGIVAERGSERLNPKARFRNFLKHEMRAFVVDSMHAILAIGLVPMSFRRNSLGEIYPFVPKFGTYTITTFAYHGEQFYKFYWNPTALDNSPFFGALGSGYVYNTTITPRHIIFSNELLSHHSPSYGYHDASVLVLHNFGADPQIDGTLTSKLSSIASLVTFRNELTDQAVTAERIAANPPIVTQHDPRLELDTVKRHQQGWFAGAGAVAGGAANAGPSETELITGKRTFERDAEQMEAFRRHVLNHASIYGADTARQTFGPAIIDQWEKEHCANESPAPVWARNAQGHTMPWLNSWYIGASRQLANLPQAQARSDYVPLIQQIEESVCGVLEVPRSILIADTNVRSGVEAVSTTFQTTVDHWGKILGAVATLSYVMIFGEEDVRKELEARIHHKRANKGLATRAMLTEDDLYEVERATEINLAFDVHPCVQLPDLSFAYERGMISWSTYAQRYLICIGLREDDLAKQTDPVAKEDRKELLLGGSSAKDKTKAKAKTGKKRSHVDRS